MKSVLIRTGTNGDRLSVGGPGRASSVEPCITFTKGEFAFVRTVGVRDYQLVFTGILRVSADESDPISIR